MKTSQELRMLSSVTLNCLITKIVLNSGSQLSEFVHSDEETKPGLSLCLFVLSSSFCHFFLLFFFPCFLFSLVVFFHILFTLFWNNIFGTVEPRASLLLVFMNLLF